jgi:hypothetical protein
MNTTPDLQGNDDPLERFQEELQSLVPRGPSRGLLDRTAEQLSRRATARGSAWRLAFGALSVAASVVLVLAMTTFHARDWRPGRAPAVDTRDAATAATGCECRVRFKLRAHGPPVGANEPSARGASANPVLAHQAPTGLPDWTAFQTAGRLDPEPNAALRSYHLASHTGPDPERSIPRSYR